MPGLQFRNISFRIKMTLIFTIVCTFSVVIAGIVYYWYAEKEIVSNFNSNSEDFITQLDHTLETRLDMIHSRTMAVLANPTFMQILAQYLNTPNERNEIIALGETSNFIKEIRMGEPLVNSILLCTDQRDLDDFTKFRLWDYNFEDSIFGKAYEEKPEQALQWFPTMEDEIFYGKERVIPYVRRFTIEQYPKGYAYLVIQLDEKQLLEAIGGKKNGQEWILVTDADGNCIASTQKVDQREYVALVAEIQAKKQEQVQEQIQKPEQGQRQEQTQKPEQKQVQRQSVRQAYSQEIRCQKETYYMSCGTVAQNGWQTYLLTPKRELLDNIRNLQHVIVLLILAMMGLLMVVVALLSRQLTSALGKLSVQMNRMRNGELDARYYYPYQDEIGSLATTFNYMADEIQKAMEKQEEYIQILKEERDYAEKVQKQKRKAELRALQSQINPHFLYNTLNTITWQAADQGADEISLLSNTLGKFFRLSLSRGAEVVSIRDELEHVRSYLGIQEIRYAEKMTYQIDAPDYLLDQPVLKLILQPLVENSIYHGIKLKEGKGHIAIRADWYSEHENYASPVPASGRSIVQLVVEDDGAGIPADQLASLNRGLKDGVSDSGEGYGIFNVNERMKLYYGSDYGLHYDSVEGQWTKAILTMPVKEWGDANV